MNDNTISWMMRLGEQAKVRRKALGLSQRAVARLADCHYMFVYDLEKGKPTLRCDKVLDVLAVLGLSLVVNE